ncbi:MAG: hypothetical protein DDT34_01649 [Firmicutes bacterium]|nr:hypothetical protein [Bacillota bacterium]
MTVGQLVDSLVNTSSYCLRNARGAAVAALGELTSLGRANPLVNKFSLPS